MNKKLLSTVAAMCFVFSVPAIVAASNLNVFLDKCGWCHKEAAQAAPVNPADKAGVVWAKYFKRGRHPGDLTASINPDEMAKVIEFLQNHAADSDHPVAAIIPK
jgi:hypothetical protein